MHLLDKPTLEAVAQVFDGLAAKMDERENFYRYENKDSLGRFHPCPGSAVQCADEAETFREHAAMIRKMGKRGAP